MKFSIINFSIIEGLYIIYMFCFFKTTIHISHPIELYYEKLWSEKLDEEEK